MQKKYFCFFLIAMFLTVILYAQHSVNDINDYNGWYEVKIDIYNTGNILFFITQCYPSGDRYEVTGNEREQLPLHLKVLCMLMVDEGMKDSFDFDEMAFDENGVFMQFTSFSLIFIFKFSNTEEEILKELGPETVNKYRFRRWP